MKPIAVIPARGGSKRILRKNLEKIGQLTAIEHAVINACESGIFESVIISTDDQEIADIAISRGAHFSSLRPSEISDDYATTLDVMSYEAGLAIKRFPSVEFVCCIYPMTPLLKYSRVQQGLDLIKSKNYNYVFSAKKSSEGLSRAIRIAEDGRLELPFEKNEVARTQDLEQFYVDAGQFYWGRIESWTSKVPILTGDSNMLLLEKFEVIDIDEPEDLAIVRALYTLQQINQQP